MQCRHGLANVAKNEFKGTVYRGMAGHHDIVARAQLSLLEIRRKGSLEASANTVTRNRVTYLFCDREAETRTIARPLRISGAFAHFDQKCRR